MIYLFCSRVSDSADGIVNWINANGGSAVRLRRTPPRTPGLVVCWGQSYPYGWPTTGYRFMNRNCIGNKLTELTRLRDGGVSVPVFSRQSQAGWLVRRVHHHEANDLLQNLSVGDYCVEYVPNIREFRIHVMNGASIRAGIKVPRTDNPNPRFRAWRAGWMFNHGQACQEVLTDSVRNAAKRAVRALGYEFGAVDVIVRPDGTPVVLEVNSAPGLEGRAFEVYGRKLMGMV